MSKLPGFITGANAKIKIGSQTMAYATDVSYNVDTVTIPVEVMGRYEVLSNEPIAYGCNGSFSVIRYTAQAGVAGIDGVSDSGQKNNGVNSITSLAGQFDPALMLTTGTFDIEIFQKIKNAGSAAGVDVKSFFKIIDCRAVRRGGSVNKRGVLVETYSFVGILAGDTDGATAVGNSGDKDLS